jgi:hypothetical protein
MCTSGHTRLEIRGTSILSGPWTYMNNSARSRSSIFMHGSSSAGSYFSLVLATVCPCDKKLLRIAAGTAAKAMHNICKCKFF